MPAIRVAVVVAVMMLSAACSRDPLAIRCRDYLKLDAATQLDLAGRWGSPNRNHPNALGQIVADEYRAELISYCGSHPKDRLRDLEIRLVP